MLLTRFSLLLIQFDKLQLIPSKNHLKYLFRIIHQIRTETINVSYQNTILVAQFPFKFFFKNLVQKYQILGNENFTCLAL